MRHTPGPWEIRSDFHSVDGFVIYHGRGNDNKTIARFPYGNVVGKPDGWEKKDRQYQELKANVNLIASAPELLEALKAIISYLPDFMVEDARQEWGNTNTRLISEAIVKAKEIVAKVEGK